MRLKSCILFAVLIVVSSCATKYAQRGSWPDMYGYTDEPLDSATYQVSFYGNSATSPSDVNRYALYRSAELTLEKGFDYFVIVDAQQNAQTNTMSMSNGMATTTATATAVAGTPIHSTSIEHAIDPETGTRIPVAVTTSTTPVTATGTAISTYSGSSMTSSYTEHSVTKTIRLFKGARPTNNPSAYDAKSMMTVMAPTVKR
jgi:hypothetical protein